MKVFWMQHRLLLKMLIYNGKADNNGPKKQHIVKMITLVS